MGLDFVFGGGRSGEGRGAFVVGREELEPPGAGGKAVAPVRSGKSAGSRKGIGGGAGAGAEGACKDECEPRGVANECAC